MASMDDRLKRNRQMQTMQQHSVICWK